MVLRVLYLTTAFSLVLVLYSKSTSSCLELPVASATSAGDQLNLTYLLLEKFHYLFRDSSEKTSLELLGSILNSSSVYDVVDQSALDDRKADQHNLNKLTNAELHEINRNYFKILNKVFSRVVLPEVYKGTKLRGAHCGSHIGCVEELPNFPALLKKSNVSSSFTIYTQHNPRLGHKIIFEPLVHYQLQDSLTNETELEERIKSLNWLNRSYGRPKRHHHITAAAWRTAARVAHSQEYPFDLAAIEQSGFNASLKTRVIIGGYFAKEDEEWIDEVVRQWTLLEPQSNIIKVSWADSNRGLYHTAAYNSRIVGRQLTLFLHYLDQLFHINLSQFHLVGHSLGAHIAGFVGADNEGRIARITGLDPAGPIFVELNASMRLDPSDARFVDVMHTNGGTITKGALGMSIPSGHVDYYGNGGSTQPGCYFSSVTKSIMDPVERVACNHRRSYRYFIEIIKLSIGNIQPADGNLTNSIGPESRESVDCFGESCSPAGAQRPPLPNSFLFEAKQDELVRLTQPEIVMMRRDSSDESPPIRRRIEFHMLNPEFPSGKRGMYFFRTRSEAPFFATKHYALTLKTDSIIRRKIALTAKINQTLVAEAELDEIAGSYSLIFAPNDPKLVRSALESSAAPPLSLMWRYRSFNLLLSQQNELHLSGLELSPLEPSDGEPFVIRYSSSQEAPVSAAAASSGLLKGGFSGHLSLTRNQWHRFEGRAAKL